MILILMDRANLAKEIQTHLRDCGLFAEIHSTADLATLNQLTQKEAAALVVDGYHPILDTDAWLDILAAYGRRLPVIVVGQPGKELPDDRSQSPDVHRRLAESITIVPVPNIGLVVDTVRSCVLSRMRTEPGERQTIPIYNAQMAVNLIVKNTWLSVLVIDGSEFRKMSLEFGVEVYHKIQKIFHDVVSSMWGAPGSFRSADLLCRKSPHSNIFYVFLERGRSGSGLPIPGALDSMADRLVARIYNDLWREIIAERKKKNIPPSVSTIPEFTIGHNSAILNPCTDPNDQVDALIDGSTNAARMQSERLSVRRKEMLQSITHASDLLFPNYQAVFRLPGLTKEMVDQAHSRRSIKPISHLLHGFESLIRVRMDWVGLSIGGEDQNMIDPRFLTPDVLFGMAAEADVAVELDQACIYQATLHSSRLPGVLMINILPRNLYHIDKLKHLLLDRHDIFFEVAEGEAINNIELLLRVRADLEKRNIRLAVDDLGKGYAGLERIISIRPSLIKFDRSLIENIHNEVAKQAFVKGLVSAAKISGAQVLAEGVELWEEAEVLQEFGADLIQGFLLHRPQTAEGILKDLTDIEMVKLKNAS